MKERAGGKPLAFVIQTAHCSLRLKLACVPGSPEVPRGCCHQLSPPRKTGHRWVRAAHRWACNSRVVPGPISGWMMKAGAVCLLCTPGAVVWQVGYAMVSAPWSRCILTRQPSAPAVYGVASVPNDRARKGGRALLCVVYLRPGACVGACVVLGRWGAGTLGWVWPVRGAE